jgi:hypothetical protein
VRKKRWKRRGKRAKNSCRRVGLNRSHARRAVFPGRQERRRCRPGRCMFHLRQSPKAACGPRTCGAGPGCRNRKLRVGGYNGTRDRAPAALLCAGMAAPRRARGVEQ